MWLESTPGAGSTFHFTLRLEHASPVTVPALPEAPLPPARPLRILLAEDNAVNQKVALHLLAKFGYRADVAANGLEVLAALRRQSFDVILMDLQMPEMDGLEATQRILKEWPERQRRPWIVALTANAMEGDREMCLAAGMDDYVSKPIKPARLAAALHQAPQLTAGEPLHPLQAV
jgi:CheY-like chemotaxis protein